jgi:hypothetical protein
MSPQRKRQAGGIALVAVGVVMLVLPGPGLPLIAVGLRRLGYLGGTAQV